MALTITHFDTCLPSYVLTHGNGEREMLLGVPVDGTTTYGQLQIALCDEWRQSSDERGEHIPAATFCAAVDELFAGVTDIAALFDASQETPDETDDSGESCYAWFRLSWEG